MNHQARRTRGVCLCDAEAAAQELRGPIVGVVTDSTGAALPTSW